MRSIGEAKGPAAILRSFRGRLALRFAATVLLVAIVGTAIGYLTLREILYSQLDRSLQRLAEIEASGMMDSPDESVHFHEELFGEEAEHEVRPTRYAMVWSVEGEPVLRTRNLQGRNLPVPNGSLRRVASDRAPEFFEFEREGRRFRGLVYPLELVGRQHRMHLLQVAAPAEQVQSALGDFLKLLTVLLLAGTAGASALGWWLAGHAVRPVMEIIRQAEALDMSRRHHRIAAEAEAEELQRLISVLNSMLGRIDAAFENQRSFLADAGHEIKTPLTVLRGDVEVALRRPRSAEEYEAVLRQTLQDLIEVSGLAEDLITLARSESGGLEPRPIELPVDRLFARVAERYAGTAVDAGMRLEIDAPDGLTVNGDSALLERALTNLVDNAVKYGRDGRHVLISGEPGEPGRVRLSVRDHGPGIPPEDRARLFERFYRGETGRRAARGSGLGLSIVKAIAEAHAGRVELESELGQGTRVTLVLPAATSRRIARDARPDRPVVERAET